MKLTLSYKSCHVCKARPILIVTNFFTPCLVCVYDMFSFRDSTGHTIKLLVIYMYVKRKLNMSSIDVHFRHPNLYHKPYTNPQFPSPESRTLSPKTSTNESISVVSSYRVLVMLRLFNNNTTMYCFTQLILLLLLLLYYHYIKCL